MLGFSLANNFTSNARTGLLIVSFFLIVSITGSTPTMKTASIRDLHFDMPYFEDQVNTWTGISLAYPTPSSMMSTDCGAPLLGGPDIQSSVAGRFEKAYGNISISFVSVFITLDLTMIDTWESNDGVVAIINDTSVGWFPWGTYPSLWSNNLCGNSSEMDLGSTKAWIAATASNTNLSVALSKYAQFTTDGNFAIRNVSITLSNKTVPSLPDFNGSSQGFCLFLSSGQIGESYRCKCDLGTYNDTSTNTCLPCDSSCETCYGGLATECLNCAPGYSYNGSVCIKCDSTCDTCFGTDSDQCATCPGGSYLYPDSTCRSTCEAAYIVKSDAYSYCDLYRCTELNTLNYQQVKNGTLYYYPSDSTCKTTCASPYITTTGWNATLCELSISKLDIQTVARLESTGATTGAVMTAGVTAMTDLNHSNPSALSVATLSKIFEYTRQFDVTRPPRLELYYKNNRASPGTIKIGSELPEEAIAKITYHTLPHIFTQNNLHSSFLVNFFVGLQTLLIIGAAALLLLAMEPLIKRKFTQLIDLCQKIIQSVLSFLMTQFYGIYADILFLGTLQFMAFSGGTALTWFGFFLAIFFYGLALFLLAFHTKLLWTYQKIKSKAGNVEGDKEMNEFKIKYKRAEVLYQDFKDLSFIHQAFLLFLTTRAAITGIVMSSLYAYPGVQIVFNIIMNLLTIIYLSFRSPYKSFPTVLQQIVYELNFVLVNICFLVMVALDVSEGDNDLRAVLGDVIINAVVASKFIPVITIVPKVIEVSQEVIKVIKNRNKPKEDYKLSREDPLPSSLKRKETDEIQPMMKDTVALELTEKISRTSTGNHLSNATLKPAKQEDAKLDLISRTCLGKYGNEFDNEAMSPIMPVYIRDTFIHKDEGTPQTSSGTYEMSIKPIKLGHIRTDAISRTCLGGEGNEFDNQEMSPRHPIYVRETVIHKDEETPKTSTENQTDEMRK